MEIIGQRDIAVPLICTKGYLPLWNRHLKASQPRNQKPNYLIV